MSEQLGTLGHLGLEKGPFLYSLSFMGVCVWRSWFFLEGLAWTLIQGMSWAEVGTLESELLGLLDLQLESSWLYIQLLGVCPFVSPSESPLMRVFLSSWLSKCLRLHLVP